MLLSFAGCAVKDTQSDSTAPAEEQTTEEKSTEPLTNKDRQTSVNQEKTQSPTM